MGGIAVLQRSRGAGLPSSGRPGLTFHLSKARSGARLAAENGQEARALGSRSRSRSRTSPLSSACPAALEYRPRKPKSSPWYRLVERYYDEVKGCWEERFAHLYGSWEQYGSDAKVALIRQSFPALLEAEGVVRLTASDIWGRGASYNGQSHLLTVPSGGTLELGILGGLGTWPRWQGRSFSLIIVDEIQSFADPAILDRRRSSLRSSADLKPRLIWAANPGGSGMKGKRGTVPITEMELFSASR
jgi:hypothetical protein